MLREVLYGIAVADAIGNPLEFLGEVTPQDFWVSAQAKSLYVSDDTQMTLFCAESLWSSEAALHRVQANLTRGYLDWYHTQRNTHRANQPGLLKFKSLFSVEAPGRTCLSALGSLMAGSSVLNDSKGNGTVMRCAPVAYWARAYELPILVAYRTAALDAAITHKHPFAAQSSQVLVGLHYRLAGGASLPSALFAVLDDLGSALDPQLHDLFSSALNPLWFKRAKSSLGGWVAEEALALAIGAVACTQTYEDAILQAITIRGDSDTVGGVAGGLAAACGRSAPEELRARVNTRDAIEHILAMTI